MSNTHELHSFFKNYSNRLAEQYAAIRSRTLEDPGTAGDQGEAAWAQLLTHWLPEGYSVVTKGRILGASGEASPQVDVIVLKPSYPKFLKEEKYYLLDGVAAVFECKTTLRSGHLEKSIKTAAAIAKLQPKVEGTVKGELLAPVIYGVLAHSHAWTGEKRAIVNRLTDEIHGLAKTHTSAPRELPELICVADLAGWRLGHSAVSEVILWNFMIPNAEAREGALLLFQKEYECYPQEVIRFPDGIRLRVERPHSEYHEQFYGQGIDPENPVDTWVNFSPLGAFIAALYDKLAYRDSSLLNICNYFNNTHIPASAGGINSWRMKLPWERNILSKTAWVGLKNHYPGSDRDWSWIYF